MAEARYLKQKEYYTNITAHDDTRTTEQNPGMRKTNTFKSSALAQEPDTRIEPKYTAKRNHIFQDRPVSAQVQRASYQDSNIFVYKDQIQDKLYGETIQKSAKKQNKETPIRDHNTWNSKVFDTSGSRVMKERNQNTYSSTVFAGPIQNRVTRTKLGGESKGTETLFGQDPSRYVQSSKNDMIAPAEGNVTQKISDEIIPNSQKKLVDAKYKELYGQTLSKYTVNTNSRKDGALMASGTDWRNYSHKPIVANSPLKETSAKLDAQERKHQNMQSSVFGGGYEDKEPIKVDKSAGKAAFGSSAEWSTQGGMAKPKNGIHKQEAFRERQKQLSSQVLPQSENYKHMPLERKEMHSFKDDTIAREAQNVTKAPGLKPNKELREGERRQEPINQQFSASDLARQVLYGKYQKASQMEAPAKVQEAAAEPFAFAGRETKAVKQAMLASNHFTTQDSSLQHYKIDAPVQVVDLVVKGLPENCEPSTLKAVSGSKHVISATVEEDNMKGTCTGAGRISLRLNKGENVDQVKMNFAKMGFEVKEFEKDPRKRPNLTGIPKEQQKEISDSKFEKQSFLQTQTPDLFGTSTKWYASRGQ